ncbi:endogenous retrovirus group K member 19 Env polyprotein-like isoform X2 [Hyaena hyaena]|uniref:endogenous retrovirus group K member 19 Env polyprotein-like isoform X2 n=1 Tax=Hyaena hyaena TaxID=95912 RepID=UPI0019237F40|nr:endogenous retrovirus group K member 19 Env polyprotein-like isoform X2 [Hyaena hyaena]
MWSLPTPPSTPAPPPPYQPQPRTRNPGRMQRNHHILNPLPPMGPRRITTLTETMSELSLQEERPRRRRHLARSMRISTRHTWGQLKTLTDEAITLVETQGNSVTPATLFVALLALLSSQASSGYALKQQYWTYIPNPPMLRPVTWDNEPISVFTNNPDLLGGSSDEFLRPQINPDFSYVGKSSSPPICFSYGQSLKGCLPVSHKGLLTDSPTEVKGRREFWSIFMLTPGSRDPVTDDKQSIPKKFSRCNKPPPFQTHPNDNSNDNVWTLIDVN